jgi:hypothetical protein
MKDDVSDTRFKPKCRMFLGIGIASMAFAFPAHASVPTQGCSDLAQGSNATLSKPDVSSELTFLRQMSLHDNLGFEKHRLLATCTATCTADGGGTYSQEPGCTYTQTCGGRPKLQARDNNQGLTERKESQL